MSQINVQNLTFAYEGSYDNIFEDVSFAFDTDWKLGFVGRNGRGKTTFLRLLMGELGVQTSISSPVACTYFPYAVEDEEANTEDLIERLCPEAQPWQWQRECRLLELTDDIFYRPFNTLSNGERTKVLLAALFVREERFLLIDEPTNHLDAAAREAVARYLNTKKGFLLVSHDRRFLDGCVDHILALNRTGIQVTKGNFSTWFANKERQEAFERGENEKLQSEIKRLAGAARRTAGWSEEVESTKIGQGIYDRGAVGHKAAKMMKRAKAIENRRQAAVEDKQKLLRDVEYALPLKISPRVHHANVLIEARGLNIAYGEHTVAENVSFTLHQGEHIALAGRNGCGKSSILKLIVGEDIPHSGTLRMASGLTISYVSQDMSFLSGDLTQYAEELRIDRTLFMTILRKLNFQHEHLEKDMHTLSMGQKKKVLLAGSLAAQAHVYVWDEPFNYVDVYSRIQVEELICKFRPTMLLVEHDAMFLEMIDAKVVKL